MNEPVSAEIPIVFQCNGEALVGIIHRPAIPADIGVVTIIAGGPQYRAGVGRGMVSAARELSSAGVPVLRFDHRGLGDSSGDFLGFEHIADDIQAAVDAFREAVPEVSKVVLWGGCDAASAAMIHGWRIEDAVSLVLGNPWVTTTFTQSAVMRKHYLSRLKEWSFWRKVLRFEYNFTAYAVEGWQKVADKFVRLIRVSDRSVSDETIGDTGNYVNKMLSGLRQFDGPVLFLMSGQSLLSREFDELVNSDVQWHQVYHRSTCSRIDFPDADQTFSDSKSRQAANRAIVDWLVKLRGN
ncbi:MAG: hydrolase 1, exosortase A system-associated [Halioglobus sp.]